MAGNTTVPKGKIGSRTILSGASADDSGVHAIGLVRSDDLLLAMQPLDAAWKHPGKAFTPQRHAPSLVPTSFENEL